MLTQYDGFYLESTSPSLVRGNSTKKNHNTSVCDRSMEIGTHDQDDLRKPFFLRRHLIGSLDHLQKYAKN